MEKELINKWLPVLQSSEKITKNQMKEFDKDLKKLEIMTQEVDEIIISNIRNIVFNKYEEKFGKGSFFRMKAETFENMSVKEFAKYRKEQKFPMNTKITIPEKWEPNNTKAFNKWIAKINENRAEAVTAI